MQPDDKICYCFHVSQRKVTNFIRIHQPQVPSQISECNSAGTGCGWCVPFLRKLFENWKLNQPTQIQLTPEEYASQRSDYVRASGRSLPPGATPLTGADVTNDAAVQAAPRSEE